MHTHVDLGVQPVSGASVAMLLQRGHAVAGLDVEAQRAQDDKNASAQRSRRLLGKAQPPPRMAVEPTEADILHLPTLRTFDDTLSQEDAETLLSYLTAPSLRLPLVLAFFARHRVGALFNAELRSIIESLVFEPGALAMPCGGGGDGDDGGGVAAAAASAGGTAAAVAVASGDGDAPPPTELGMSGNTGGGANAAAAAAAPPTYITEVPVPAAHASLLATRHGVLLNALLLQPEVVVAPLVELANAAADLCGGDFQSSFVDLLLFVVRLTAHVQGYLDQAMAMARGGGAGGRAGGASPACLRQGPACATQLQRFFWRRAAPMVRAWIREAAAAAHTKLSTVFHAHMVVLLGATVGHVGDMAAGAGVGPVYAELVASTAFVTAWVSPCSANASPSFLTDTGLPRTLAGPTTPTHDVFKTFHMHRRGVVRYIRGCSGEERGAALGATLHASLRQQGLATSGWEQVPAAPMLCTQLVESRHPYLPSQRVVRTVSFPGADCITVCFDDRTHTENPYDCITFYKVCVDVGPARVCVSRGSVHQRGACMCAWCLAAVSCGAAGGSC